MFLFSLETLQRIRQRMLFWGEHYHHYHHQFTPSREHYHLSAGGADVRVLLDLAPLGRHHHRGHLLRVPRGFHRGRHRGVWPTRRSPVGWGAGQ